MNIAFLYYNFCLLVPIPAILKEPKLHFPRYHYFSLMKTGGLSYCLSPSPL